MNHFILFLLLISIIPMASAKTRRHPKTNKTKIIKLSEEDAKELCLTNIGASISDSDLKICINKTLKAGKYSK